MNKIEIIALIERMIEDCEALTPIIDKDLRDYYEGKQDGYWDILFKIEDERYKS